MKTTVARPGPGIRERAAPPDRDERRLDRQSGLRVGTLFGIELRLEGSWFVVFALLIASFASHLAAVHPQLAVSARWLVAAAASLLFFGSILLHELAHSVVAQRRGLSVHGITLMLFGGVSHLASEPKRPKDDLAIALVGPLASALLGALFLGLAPLASPVPVARSVATWLGTINLALAAFNLLPGFPLDGGRVLKGLLWILTGDPAKAFRLAIEAGRFVAYGLILAGAFLVFQLGWTFDGLWLGFLGWYLLSGAQTSRQQLTLRGILQQHLVRDVLHPPEAVVRPDESLSDAVEAWVLRRGHRTILVSEGARLLGLLTLHEIKAVPQDEWSARTVGQVMIPAGLLEIAVPEQNLLQAFQRMNERRVNQLPVVCNGDLIGLLSREDVLRVMAIHSEIDPLLPGRPS